MVPKFPLPPALNDGELRVKMRMRSATVAVVALLFSLIVGGVTAPPAIAVDCVVGSSSSCPGASAEAIKDATGTNTDGVYWILVNGVATQVYSIMNSAMDGGGWMLAMKGANTGNTFGYSADYWTTTNTLNPTLTRRNDTNNEDAKFDVFNYTRAAKVLAVFPDAPAGGAITNQSYGFTWKESMPTPANTTAYSGRPTQGDYTGKTLRELFAGGEKIFIRDATATSPYLAVGTSVFSTQTDVRFFGYNYVSTGNNNRARFGFGWNENGGGVYPGGNEASNDVSGGIGIDRVGWSAGDVIGCCQNKTALNRQMKFEIYVKAFQTTPRAVQNLAAQPSNQQVTLTWGTPSDNGGFAIDAYKVETSTDQSTWTVATTLPGTVSGTAITGLTNSQRYYFKVTPHNLAGDGSSSSVSAIPSLPPTAPRNATAVSSSFPSDCAVSLSTQLTNTITRSADGECVVTFTGVGTTTWIPPDGVTSVQVLVVGGGGGGGSDMGGGGGAGGLVYYGSETPRAGLGYSVSGPTTLTVGAGGAGAPPGTSQVRGTNGSNSVFGGITAIGGGGGASTHNNSNSPAGVGGSGGGASGGGGGNGGAFGLGTTGQGNAGSAAGGAWYPGGGGGAGGPGFNTPGTGGPGLQDSLTGTPIYFAGGGGGSGYTGIGGNGGAGGGGGGAVGETTGGSGLNPGLPGGGGSLNSATNMPGGNAGANTGGGGGGGSHFTSNNKGGNGGSGVVIIKFPAPPSAGAAVYFDLPTSDGGQPITQYVVTASDGHTGTGTHSPVYVAGLTAGQGYSFIVTAINPAGSSPDSNRTNTVWPVVYGGIGAPKNVVATSGPTQALLAWSPPDSSTVTISDYLVQYKTLYGSWQEWLRSPSTDTSTTITGLTDGETYSFRVASWGQADSGTAISTWVISNAVIPATPYAGSFGTVTPTATGFTVPINNFDNRFSWSGSATNGATLSVSGPVGAWPADLTPYSRYQAGDYNVATRTWLDSSGNNRNILPTAIRGSPTVETTTAGTNGTTQSFNTVKGTTADGIRLGNAQLANWTMFHVARYQGTANGCMFTSVTDDLFSGFYGGNSGISSHNGWITSNANQHGNNWVASTDFVNGYRSNGVSRGSTTGGITYLPPMSINYGARGEYSDFQVAEVILFDRQLTTAEIARMEDYLGKTYGISGYTTVSSSSSDTPTVTVTGAPGGVTTTGTLNVVSGTPGILSNSFNFSGVATTSLPSAPRVSAATTTGSNSVKITWKAPTRPGGVITSYTATAQSQGNSCTWTSGPLECTITGLGNQLDTVTVTATNATGTSLPSTYLVVGTYVPTFGTPVPTAQGFSVQISNYITSWNGFPITWASTVNAGGTSVISSTGLLTVTRVMGGESSTAIVTPTTAGVGTRVSSSSIAVTANTAIPTMPQNVSITTAPNRAVISWTTPDIPGGPITSYTATSSRTGSTCTWTTGVQSCTITGLPEQIDTFTVTATNSRGTSSPTAAVTGGTYIATFGTPVPSPEGFSVPITNYATSNNGIDLAWGTSATNKGVTRLDDAQTISLLAFESSTATTYGAIQPSGTTGTLTYVDGKVGKAIQFNGSSYVTMPRPVTGAFSTSFWIKTTQTSCGTGQWYQGCGIIDARVGGTDFGISLVGNSIGFGIGSGDVTATSYHLVNDGAWHHIATTWNTTTGKIEIYLDGSLDGTAIANTVPRTASANIYIGKGLNYAGLVGALDEIRFYNGVLTQAQVTASMADSPALLVPSIVVTRVMGGESSTASAIVTNNSTYSWLWTDRASTGTLTAKDVAISDNGRRLVAVDYNNGGISLSADGGVTWREAFPAGSGYWASVASSADGRVILAVGQNRGPGYTAKLSTDFGATWSSIAPSCGVWQGSAMSADGAHIVIGCGNGGSVAITNDAGATWSYFNPPVNWASWVAMSSDGRYVAVATGQSGGNRAGPIYTSSDFGATFTTQLGSGNHYWNNIAISDDGTRLAASSYDAGLYTSSDCGVTWTLRYALSGATAMSASSDGSTIVMSQNGGGVFISTNYGVTFTQLSAFGNRAWATYGGVNVSRGGTTLVGTAEEAGHVYTATTGYHSGIGTINATASTAIPTVPQTLTLSPTYLYPAGVTPYMRFEAANYDPTTKIWLDTSGNSRNVLASAIGGAPTLVTVPANANGTKASFKVVQGTPSDSIRFNNPTFTTGNWTFVTFARYSGTNRNRIFDAEGQNWLDGFYGGMSGVAHHNSWITNTVDRHGNNWVLSSSYRNTYRSNGVTRGTSGGDANFYPMAANYVREQSDFQIAEVIIFNRELSTLELSDIENYLAGKYGLMDYTIPSASSSDTSTLTVGWSTPDVPGGPITSYTVSSDPASTTCTWTTGDKSCTLRGLLDRYYTFNVTATNASGTSAAASIGGGKYEPIFGTATPTVVGYSVPLLNYDSRLTYTGTATNGGTVEIKGSSTFPAGITPYMRFEASNYDPTNKIWKDSSGSARDVPSSKITGTPSLVTVQAGQNGSQKTIQVVAGGTSESIRFNNPTFTTGNWTFFTFARYSGTNRNRIFDAEGQNWLDGFYGGMSGVAHHNSWITNTVDRHGNNWVLSSSYRNTYRSNGVTRGTSGGDANFYPMAANYVREQSDFQIAEVIIFNRELSPAEVSQVEDYLAKRYGLLDYPTSFSAGSTLETATVTVSGLIGGTTSATTISAASSVSGLRNGSGVFTATASRARPTVPRNVAVVPQDGGMTISWDTPAVWGGIITDYTVTAQRSGNTCQWTNGPLNCVMLGLTNGVPETFTVTATNITGTSDVSSAVVGIPQRKPGMPTINSLTGVQGISRPDLLTDGLVQLISPSAYTGSGTSIIDPRGGSNMTLYNAPTYSSAEPAYFPLKGSNQYLLSNTGLASKLAMNGGTRSNTIAPFVWVYPTSANGVILDEVGQMSINGGWHDSHIEIVGGTMKFRVWSGAVITSSIATPLNNWYYVGYVYNESTSTLTAYINGQVAGTSTGYSRQSPYNNGGVDQYYAIGATDGTSLGSGAYMAMRFGGLYVYNKALTLAQIQNNMDATSGGFTTPLSTPSAEIAFTPPVDNGGGTITSYIATSSGGQTATSATSPVTVKGLTNGVEYTFTLRAVNAAGSGPSASTTTPFVPKSAPTTPLAPTGTLGDGRIFLVWSAPDANGDPITDYDIQYSANSGSTWSTFVDGVSASTSATVTGLTNGTSYLFRIRVKNAQGASAYSAASTGYSPASLPSAPAAPTGIASGTSVYLTWSAPANNGAAITDYLVQYSSNNGSTWTTFADPVSATTGATVTGLSAGSSYVFRAAAINGVGTSAYSPISLSTSLGTPPNPPTDLAGTASGGQVALTWSAPAPSFGGLKDATGTCATSVSNSVGVSLTLVGSECVLKFTGQSSTTWTVPGGVGAVVLQLDGASAGFGGNDGRGYGYGGPAGRVSGILPIAPGSQVVVAVGSAGANGTGCVAGWGGGAGGTNALGYNGGKGGDAANYGCSGGGGGGGAASVIRVASRDIVAAGAGAGAGGNNCFNPTAAQDGQILGDSLTATAGGDGGSTPAADGSGAGGGGGGARGGAGGVMYNPCGEVQGLGGVMGTNADGGNSSLTLSTFTPDVNANGVVTIKYASSAVGSAAPIDDYLIQYSANSGDTWTVFTDPVSSATSGAVTGLTNGVSYIFRVASQNGQGTSVYSPPSSAYMPRGGASAPTISSVVPGNGSVKVNITAPSSDGGSAITRYTVTASPGNASCVWTSGPLACTIAGLTNGTTYSFTAIALTAIGSSPASAAVTGKPRTLASSPSNVTVSSAAGQATVTWSASTANGGDTITAYVATSSPGGQSCTSAAGALTCTVTGLTNGVSYIFTVAAVNGAGSSVPSAPSNPAMPVAAPGAPTALIATVGSGSAFLTWGASASNGLRLTDYEVQLSTDSGTSWTAFDDGVGITTAATITGLTNGTSYSFRVRGVNTLGGGTWSAPSSAATPATIPGTPTSLSYSASNAQAVVTFTAPANGGAAITKYQYSINGGLSWLDLTGTTSPLTIPALTNGVTYSISLRAVNSQGGGPATASTNVTPVSAPDAPVILSTVAESQKITVAYTAPNDNGGAAITSFSYRVNAGTWTTSNSSPLVISSLTNGTSYTIDLRATNTAGSGSSATVTSTPFTTPGTPTINSVTPGNATLSLAFTAGSNGGSAILGYEYSVDGGTSWTRPTGTVSPLSIAGVVNGTSYAVKLRAYNLAGSGSAATAAASTPRTVPGVPQITSVTPGSGTITVGVTASDGGSAITGYKYRVRSSTQTNIASCSASYDTLTWNAWPGSWSVTSASSSLVITVSGTNCFDVQLMATNAAGDGAASRASGKPLTAPSAPSISSVIPGNAKVIVNFVEPSDNGGSALTKYQYQVNGGTWVDLTTGGGFTVGSSTRFVITGLTNGSSASILLRAVNSTGPSTSSAAMSATPVTTPDAPTSANLTPIDGGFKVDFTAAGNGGSPITAYDYRVTATGTTPLGPWLRAVWTSGTTFTIAGLTNGSSYDVDLRAVNAIGAGSELLGPSSSPGAQPAPPTIANVIAGDSKISIVITPGNNGGYAISQYSYSINGGTTWITPTPNPLTNPIVVTGLTNGTAYQVRVRTRNTLGDSDPSAISVATPATSSAAPAITAVTPADGSLSVAFNAPTNTGGSPIITYEYSIDGGTLWNSRGAASTTSPLVITGVRNGAAYPIKIRAITAIAQGAASTSTLAIPQVPGAGKPTNVIATPLNGAALVSWRAPEGWVGDPIASYRVNASPGSATCTWSSGPSSCQVDGLTNGTTYTFSVTSVGAAGDIDFANSGTSITPRAAPTAPRDVTALPGGGEAALTWTAPTDSGGSAITDYVIQFSSDSGTVWTTFAHDPSTDPTNTVNGLNPSTPYIFRVAATNASDTGPNSAPTASITTYALGPDLALAPLARTADGFTFQLTLVGNGSSGGTIADYSITASSNTSGATVVRDGTTFTVKGLNPGAVSSVSLSAARSGYATSRASITGTALLAGTVPVITGTTNTENGFTFNITNYGASGTTYTYSISGPGSVVDDASGRVRLVGLAPGESAVLTVRANRYGYTTTSTTVTGSVLKLGVPPVLSAATSARRSYSFFILDWVAGARYTLSSTVGATAVLETTTAGSEVTAKVTVSNLAYGASARTTVLIQRTGYADASMDVVGAANAASSDATLSALSLSTGAIDGFISSTPNYTVNVPFSTTSVQVRPTKNEIDAVIRYSIGSNTLAAIDSAALSPSMTLSVGSNTITVQVTAANGSVNTYLVRVVRAPSTNATLSALSTTAGSIGTFTSDLLSYVTNVKYDTATVTVAATLSDSNATMQVRINGGTYSTLTNATASNALTLQVGNNAIQIVVTAQDGTTLQTYTLTVARGGPTKAQLSALTVSPGTILNFDPATLNYEVNLPAGTATITITPTATADAFIWIRGVNVLSGVAAPAITLSPGITTIPILVTSADLTVTTPYQVRVTLDSVPAGTSVTRRSVGTTSGVVFTTQPQVTVVDSASQPVLLGTYTVRARISSGAGGTLIGTTTATTTRGVATFTSLGIRGIAGTQYSIAYEVDNLTADAQNVTVTPGAATQLAVVRTAEGAQNASTFTTQPRVSIQDALGNVVTNASDPISVAITAGAGGTLTGNGSQVASNGITTFAGLGMRGVAGRTYTLTYSSGSLTPVTQTIVVTPGAAQDLTLTRPSSGLTSGDTFTVQPQVSVIDSGGNTVTSATGTITISLSGANGAVLDGVRTASLESGTATFAGLALSGPGNQDYTLSYTLSGVGSVTEVVRLAPGAPHHIDLTRSAAGFYNGAAFSTQPEVTVYDKTNNPIPNLSGTVDATVSGTGTLVGLRSTIPVGGLASFTNLGISGTTGSTYVVTYSYGSLAVESQTVTVSAGASLTPTIGAIASTPAGFAFQIDNFTNLFRWDLRVSGDTSTAQLALSPTGLVSVSGLTVGSSATVSLTTSRAGYLSGTANVTATALRPSIKPTFGSIIQTTTGFKVQIRNYDSSYSFSASASNGAFAAVSSSGLVTVTGLVAGATSIATVTSSRTNYAAVSAQIAGSSSGSGGSVPTDLSANLASGKTVTPVCDGATSTLDGIANVNDQRSSTKFLCFLSADNTNTSYSRNSSGLIFSGMDTSLVTGIQFTTGDADASRDPMVFSLYGCNADGSVCRTLVANGRTGLSDARNVTGNIQSFRNATKFATIKILFVSLRNSWTDAMQIAEVALVGTAVQASALVPTFGTITSNVAGYDVVISNFDGSLNWSGTGDAGTAVSVGSDGIAHISGVRPGETATVSISASSADRATGSATVTGGSLLTALIPVLGATTATSDGFTASITNYSSLYTWVAGVDSGTASITPVDATTATLRVAGQSGSGSVLTKVTTTRTGYASGVSYIRSSTTNPGLMPLFGASVQSLDGFSVQLSNYDSAYTWTVSTSSGTATISNTGLVVVKGMASGATAVINVTTTRTGYFDVLGSTTGYAAVGNAITPRFGLTNSNATGFTVQISNFDTGFAWSGRGTNGETVTISADGLVTVTGVTSLRSAVVTISASKNGYVTGTAQVTATAIPQQTQSLAGSDVSISIPVSASSSVSDVTIKVDIPVDAAPASTVFTTTALATDGVDAGLRTITIKASNAGSLITDLNTPISITLPSASITGVPVYSPDGVQLIYIPQLTSLYLPDGQPMGFFRYPDGSIVILSRTL